MSKATREEFYQRLEGAPYAAQGFFETIETRFEPRNSALVHFTHTNVVDMRIAVPQQMKKTGQDRNFATMYWQVNNRVIHSRIFLTPEELANLGFSGAEEPKSSTEPLNAELRLSEDFWRYKAEDFSRYLEAAHIKMLAQC